MEKVEVGYTVTRNGITITKPDWMSDNYSFTYEAPRVGKFYGSKTEDLYGSDQIQPSSGTDERGEGCDGGACAI